MARPRLRFACSECGHIHPRWAGRCGACGAWNSLHEEQTPSSEPEAVGRVVALPKLGDASAEDAHRFASGFPELDRVLGGGFVAGSVVLLGGDPGIGKSTLLLDVAARTLAAGRRVVYLAGEESPAQLALRARRIGAACDALPVLVEHRVEDVTATLRAHPADLVIIDSIQTLEAQSSASAAGSVSQLRDVTAALTTAARETRAAFVLVGHVTRTGSLAGPRVVEHLVDTVLYLEGEATSALRVVRAVKNRFGSTLEVGLLEMSDRGLLDGAPSLLDAAASTRPRAPGVAASSLLEGSRAFPVEIQSLVSPAVFGPPRIHTAGIDTGRVQMLAAILERHVGDAFGGADIYLNVAGGLRLQDPSCDLAVAFAMTSSLRGRSLPPDLWVVGELGLTGEVRAVLGLEARASAAARAGFRRAIVPRASLPLHPESLPLQLLPVDTLVEAVAFAFDAAAPSHGRIESRTDP